MIADCRMRIAESGSWIEVPNPHSEFRNPQSTLLFFFHLDDDAAAVKSTLGTHTMRQARLAAMGTASHGRRSQVIVSPALARARL